MYDLEEVMMHEETVPAIKQDMELIYKNTEQTRSHCIYKMGKYFRALNRDDIKGKANEIFVECYYKYRNDCGASFNTYFSNILNLKLYRWCKKSTEKGNREIDIDSQLSKAFYSCGTYSENDHIIEIPEERKFYQEFGYFAEGLSDECKKILSTAYLEEKEIKENNNSKYKTKVNKSSLMKYLIKNKNMNRREILNSYAEIKSALGEYYGRL